MPDVIGLCPVHLHEFYAPHGGICPQCQRTMVEYVPASGLEQLQALLLLIFVSKQVARGPEWQKRAWAEALELTAQTRAG
jgi:hypothetical protein